MRSQNVFISGDKGHGRTIITATLLDQKDPNSSANTDVFLMYEGDDRNGNLRIVSYYLLLETRPWVLINHRCKNYTSPHGTSYFW